jgi:hypothetical protein
VSWQKILVQVKNPFNTKFKERALCTKQNVSSTENCTFIWFSAESFKPVISKTFTQVVIGRPYFFDAVGYETYMQVRIITLRTRKYEHTKLKYSPKQCGPDIH